MTISAHGNGSKGQSEQLKYDGCKLSLQSDILVKKAPPVKKTSRETRVSTTRQAKKSAKCSRDHMFAEHLTLGFTLWRKF